MSAVAARSSQALRNAARGAARAVPVSARPAGARSYSALSRSAKTVVAAPRAVPSQVL